MWSHGGDRTIQQGSRRRTLPSSLGIKAATGRLCSTSSETKTPAASGRSNMKVLVLLGLFSVCSANILWQEPKTNLDVVKDAFWDYVAKATATAEDSLRQIQESELGQEVNMKISQSADTVNQYIVALRAQAAPVSQDFLARLSQEAEQLKARLQQELAAAGGGVQPQAEQLLVQLQSRVEELKKEAAPYVEAMDPEALKALLLQKSQELKGQLETQMVPYTEEMKERVEQSVEEFQRTVLPLAQSFQTQLAQKSQEIQQNLVPLGEGLKAKLDSGTQDLQAKLVALWEAFTKKSQ